MYISSAVDDQVEQLLSRVWGSQTRLKGIEVLRDHRCFRLLLDSKSSEVPGSSILKVALDEPGCITDPDSAAPNPAQAILDEWAGLEFLNEIFLGRHFVPRLYGGNRDAAILLIEDLGSSDSLVDVLRGSDRELAVESLFKHTEALAELHSSTFGREKRYTEIRSSLGPIGVPRDWKRYGNLLATQGWGNLYTMRTDLARSFSFIGQDINEEFWEEYDCLAAAIHGPSPFRAYVHNDTCPDNSLMTSSGLKLIDFERSGYHHCLLDVAYYRLGMPHCFWAGELPSSVVTQIENRYREHIAPSLTEISDDACFGSAITDACCYWVISSGLWFIDKDFKSDFAWGNSTWRQRVLFRLKQFSAVTEEYEHLRVMGGAARETLRILGSHWNCNPLPRFSAFVGA